MTETSCTPIIYNQIFGLFRKLSALLRLCVFIIKVFRRTVQGQCKFTNNSEDGEKIQAKKPFFLRWTGSCVWKPPFLRKFFVSLPYELSNIHSLMLLSPAWTETAWALSLIPSNILTSVGNKSRISISSLFHQRTTLHNRTFFVYICNTQRLVEWNSTGRVHKCDRPCAHDRRSFFRHTAIGCAYGQ